METLATAPALPSRHPGRIYRIETNNITPPPQPLSDELVDLWEHATLLFYGYELQASAENFLYLSAIIDQRYESAQCLLNAAIIFARIGNLAVASEALEGAYKADEFRALALYFSGHVEFELGDLQKSEICLYAALEALEGRKQHFARLGLDFALESSQIRHVLEAFDVRALPIDPIPTLGVQALPAGSIFEAPQRLPDSGYASPQSPIKPADIRQSQDYGDKLNNKRTPKALLARSSRDHNESPVSHKLKSLEYSNGDVQWHEPMGIPQVTSSAAPLAPRRSLRTLGGLVRQFSGRRRAKSDLSKKPLTTSSRAGLLGRLVPREAKVQDDSVQDLAGFIRDLPRQHGADESNEPTPVQGSNEMESATLQSASVVQEGIDHPATADPAACSTVSDESTRITTASVSEDATGPTDSALDDPEDSIADSLYEADLSRSSSPLEVRGRTLTRSIRSVYTDNMDAMADDEASDSDNDTNPCFSRSETPTPGNQ